MALLEFLLKRLLKDMEKNSELADILAGEKQYHIKKQKGIKEFITSKQIPFLSHIIISISKLEKKEEIIYKKLKKTPHDNTMLNDFSKMITFLKQLLPYFKKAKEIAENQAEIIDKEVSSSPNFNALLEKESRLHVNINHIIEEFSHEHGFTELIKSPELRVQQEVKVIRFSTNPIKRALAFCAVIAIIGLRASNALAEGKISPEQRYRHAQILLEDGDTNKGLKELAIIYSKHPDSEAADDAIAKFIETDIKGGKSYEDIKRLWQKLRAYYPTSPFIKQLKPQVDKLKQAVKEDNTIDLSVILNNDYYDKAKGNISSHVHEVWKILDLAKDRTKKKTHAKYDSLSTEECKRAELLLLTSIKAKKDKELFFYLHEIYMQRYCKTPEKLKIKNFEIAKKLFPHSSGIKKCLKEIKKYPNGHP